GAYRGPGTESRGGFQPLPPAAPPIDRLHHGGRRIRGRRPALDLGCVPPM
ncbi:MAG: hypothetical protein AVDCRST_MAG10-484, partial [uncultured Acidimicrobiales bacterium]